MVYRGYCARFDNRRVNERADRRVNPRASRKVQIRGIFFRRHRVATIPPRFARSLASPLPSPPTDTADTVPARYIRTILLCSGYCICVCTAIPINTINSALVKNPWEYILSRISRFSLLLLLFFFKNSGAEIGRAGVSFEKRNR